MLSSEERKVLELLGKAWNEYIQLPIQHEADRPEFQQHLHSLQNLVLSRPAYRHLHFEHEWGEKDKNEK